MASGAPYRFERAAWRRGVSRLAGVDEAGRGPLAGPVVAAAVVLAPGDRIAGVDDSKRLAAPDREFPAYGFVRHKGYATPEHRDALERHGPCPLHRRTFAGIWNQLALFSRSELQWIGADS